jgi:hypothetical protein
MSDLKDLKNGWSPYLAIFAGYSSFIFAFRYSLPKVFGADWIGLFLGQNYHPLLAGFQAGGGDAGFRPLNSWVSSLFAGDYQTTHSFVRYCLSLGLLNGCVAVLFYFVCTRILSSCKVALLATVLFLFSGPTISGCWHQLFGNSQILTILAILLGFTFYLLYCESRHAIYLFGLAFTFLVAPWFRQYGALLAMCVFVVEVFGRRQIPVLILALLGSLHALQPKMVLWLAGIIDSVQGGLVDEKIAAKYLAEEGEINKRVFARILTNVAPFAWIGLVASLRSLLPKENKWLNRAYWFFMVAAISGTGVSYLDPLSLKALAFFAISGFFLCVVSFPWWTRHPNRIFLIAWVLLGTGPILKVAINHEMHLIYAMAPICMIFAESMKAWKGRTLCALAFVCLPVGDQLLNAWNSWRAQSTIMRAHNEMAPVVRALPGNETNLVLCNFFDCTELIDLQAPPRLQWINQDGPLAHDSRWPTLHNPDLQLKEIREVAAKGGQSYYLIQQEPQFNGTHILPDITLTPIRTFEARIVQTALDPLRGIAALDTYQRFLAYTDWVHSFGFVTSKKYLGLVAESDVKWILFKVQ